MSEPYTPTTEEVRAAASRAIGGDWFDRWLAEHDRQVAERAWDEGFDKATSLVSEDFWSDAWSDDHSPYRVAKGEQK